MTQTVEMWKCLETGRVFATEREAARSEFRAKLVKVADRLPSMAGTTFKEDLAKTADALASGAYQNAWPALQEAMTYFDKYTDLLVGR